VLSAPCSPGGDPAEFPFAYYDAGFSYQIVLDIVAAAMYDTANLASRFHFVAWLRIEPRIALFAHIALIHRESGNFHQNRRHQLKAPCSRHTGSSSSQVENSRLHFGQ
jgi:hypothetical protein